MRSTSAKRAYYVYILKCADGTLYTGITTDPRRRLAEHKKGVGSHYTRSRGAVNLVYQKRARDRSTALKSEAAIKRLTRAQKLALVAASPKRV